MKDCDWSVWVHSQSFISSLILNLKLRLLSLFFLKGLWPKDSPLIWVVWSLQWSWNKTDNSISTYVVLCDACTPSEHYLVSKYGIWLKAAREIQLPTKRPCLPIQKPKCWAVAAQKRVFWTCLVASLSYNYTYSIPPCQSSIQGWASIQIKTYIKYFLSGNNLLSSNK